MAINFTINDKVISNTSYINNYLQYSTPNTNTLHQTLQSLGYLGAGILQVLAVGNYQIYSFIRLLPLTPQNIPNISSAAYQAGQGLTVFFDSDDTLNSCFRQAVGIFNNSANSMLCLNNSSRDIYKGAITCQTGNDLITGMSTLALASAASPATAYVCGLAEADIPIGSTGYTQFSGYYQGINTLGGNVSDPMFLSVEPGLLQLLPENLICPVGAISSVGSQGTILLLGMTPFGRPGPFPVRGQFG